MRPLPQLLAGLCASFALGLLAVVAVDAPEAGTIAASPSAGAPAAQDCRPVQLARSEAVVVPDVKRMRHYSQTPIVKACD